MQNQNAATKVVLTDVRLSYAHLFEAQSINGSDPKFSTSIIIDKKNKKLIKQIEAAIEAAATMLAAKCGGKMPKKYKIPLRDGDEERDDEAYANAFFLNANCKTKPGVVDKNCKPILDQDEVYSGCYAHVSVTFYAFNSNGNAGIACGLNNVMKVKDGEPLGGRATAQNDFAGLVNDDDEDDDI